MKTVLTGIKPTGMPHLGNYLGAIKPAIEMSKKADADSRYIYFIADYHALTKVSVKSFSEEFKQNVYEVACTWLAFGLDPKKVIFYRQGDVSEIFELNWILSCHIPKGDLNRAHAYKAAVASNEEKGLADKDHGINVGLFNYPVLMAADILLFDTNLVPVGQDQVQHVEIARSIAQRFNQYHGETLVEPQEFIQKTTGVIQGLDGRKMSKSYNNTIPLFVPEKKLKKLVNKITTDSTPPEAPKDPNNSLIFDLYKLFASDAQIQTLEKRYHEGISWGEAKAELFEVLNDLLKEPREKYNYFMENKHEVDKLLEQGAIEARSIAKEVLSRTRKALTGFN